MAIKGTISGLFCQLLPLLALVACASCTPADDNSVQEACAVLRTADSLRAQGVLIDDSTALARAVTVLGRHPRRHADDYVRACYYYGCLLRSRNNYIAAMQTFINAAHTDARDHTILGQTYCNMGVICYQEGNFQLAFEMHTLSAQQHKLAADSVRYNYALYEMAYALMKQHKKDSAMCVLADIEKNTSDSYTLSLVNLTKASLYRDIQQYDSALYYADKELTLNPEEATGLMVKAQSFSLLGIKDSAAYYARLARKHTSSWDNLINIYYILAHDDNTIDEETRQQYHADRADLQTLTKQRQGRLAQAVMLLRQDMEKKPDYRWLYAIALTILIISVVGISVLLFTRRHRALVRQQRLEEQNRLERQLQNTQKAIAENEQNLAARNKALCKEIESVCGRLAQAGDIRSELHWNSYEQMCSVINRLFYHLADRLWQTDGMGETDIRLCILVLIGFTHEEIADILPCSQKSVKTMKRRTAMKLGTNGRDLRMFLLKMTANMSA